MESSRAVGDKYRVYLHGEGEKNTKWRFGGPPNYDIVDKLFEEGRTTVWPSGSLEEKVQNILKTWEMELFHKECVEDYKSVNPNFTYSVNGRKRLTLEEMMKIGGYNVFMQNSLPKKFRAYDPSEETAESSHVAFTIAFPRGFAIEVVQVYSGSPVIVYKFRHWGYMEGPLKNHLPTGELVEIYGIGIFEVDEDMKITKVESFFDSSMLLSSLMKYGEKDGSAIESEPTTSACPVFLKNRPATNEDRSLLKYSLYLSGNFSLCIRKSVLQ